MDPTPVRCPAPALHVGGCLRVRVVGDDHALPPDDAASTPPGNWFVVEAIARHAHDPRRRQVIRVRRFETLQGPRYVFPHAMRSVAADAPR